MDFDAEYGALMAKINAALPAYFEKPIVEPLVSAMRYSLFAGGKRLRPVLCLAANAMGGGNEDEAMPVACAIEMIHTYSLIHDDLPAMDNDDLRRGRPTNHMVFGEAMAILAGDGLLTYAFEIMLKNAVVYNRGGQYITAVLAVANGAGVNGMVAGQTLDIMSEGRESDAQSLANIHSRKTGALIEASVKAGLLLCGPTQSELEAISDYGKALGMLFQITDDILDETGSSATLGKTAGKDEKADKLTYPRVYGLAKSREMAEEYAHKAVGAIEIFAPKHEFLRQLALAQLDRNK